MPYSSSLISHLDGRFAGFDAAFLGESLAFASMEPPRTPNHP